LRIPGGILSLLLLILPLWPTASQDLSTYVSPSEDEWLQALTLGEISYVQYLCLIEIARHGIDSSSLYLLDEIPNLSYFLNTPVEPNTPLEQEQQRSVTSRVSNRDKGQPIKGRFDYRYLQRFEDEEKNWYRSTVRLTYSKNLTATWRINRESSGRERIVYRSLGYTRREGYLRSATVGSFTARLGLGTLFGYRGKVMSGSDKIDVESLAYPDYGGYNGMHLIGRVNEVEVQFLGSLVRDESHRLASVGMMVKDRAGSFRPGVIVGINELVDRHGRENLRLPMFAVHGEYRYAAGCATAEVAHQIGPEGGALSAVVEGRHRAEIVEIRFAGWVYGDRFRDLTTGSKTGNVYQSYYLEDVDFEYSSKRTGQEGFLMKTIIPLAKDLKATNAVLFAHRNRYNTSTQYSTALIKTLGGNTSLQLDCLWRQKVRHTETMADRNDRGRWRLEGRFNSGDLYLRSYIGYNTDSERRDYLSLTVFWRSGPV